MLIWITNILWYKNKIQEFFSRMLESINCMTLIKTVFVSCWYSFFTEFWIFSVRMNLKSVVRRKLNLEKFCLWNVKCCFLFCLTVVFISDKNNITSDWSPEQQLSRGPGAELVASAKWDVVLCGRRQTDHVDTKCGCRVYPAAPG